MCDKILVEFLIVLTQLFGLWNYKKFKLKKQYY